MNKPEIHGHCDDRFQRVKDAFVANFARDFELGASFALSIDEEMVVDLWGGHADAARTRLWRADSITSVASSSKIIVALCGLMLVDRGLVALDEPVATYWPEFGANGKETLPVRYLFSHSAGLPGLDGMPGFDVLADYAEVTKRLAAQKPWWTPGEQSGYHALTFGHLLAELVQRTTGKTISQFFRSELADPADIDFHFGLPEAEAARFAEVMWADGEAVPIPENSMTFRVMGYLTRDPTAPGADIWHMNIPAGNGVTNARALARVGSILATGGMASGRRYLAEETIALALEEQSYKRDLVFWAPVRYGLGFGLASEEFPLPWPHGLHWGGRGGSSVIMAPEIGAAMAYVPSKFYQGPHIMDHRGEALRDAAIACLRA